jgi:hypothetical protein
MQSLALTALTDDVLRLIGSFFDLSEAPLIIMTGGLPAPVKERACITVDKVRRLQEWWRCVRFPSQYDPSWCLTPDHEWSCRLGERMYKRFMLVRFPLEHVLSHGTELAWALLSSTHLTDARIYGVDNEDYDYLVSEVDACCLDGSLRSWKTMLGMSDAQTLGTIGF